MTLHEAVDKHGSKRAAAKALGIPWTTFRRQYKDEVYLEAGAGPVCQYCNDTGKVVEIESVYGFPAEKVEKVCPACTEAAAVSNLDVFFSEPAEVSAKSTIEQHVRDAGFSMDDVASAWLKSKEHSVQVKKRPQPVTLTNEFVATLEKARTRVVRAAQHESADCMLVVSLHDAHFGKLSYLKEAGHNYDPDITASIYREAVWDALKFFNPTRIKQIVFPIGSDLLHVDNMQGTTTAGTPVESVDTRFQRVFDIAMAAVISALEDCVSVADVYAPVVPGNHDYCSSILLAKAVKQYFKDDPRLVVDDDEISRKFYHWGKNLICFSHRFTKLDRAPIIMATEAPEQWAQSITREIHTGHLHTQRAKEHYNYYESAGVVVRILPSLSATDRWHFDSGFIGSTRAAESHLYSFTEGYIGSHLSRVRC